MQEHPSIRGLAETTASQEKAIRKLEMMVAEAAPLRDTRMSAEELGVLFSRVGTFEQRLECFEHKVRRIFVRMPTALNFCVSDAALQELSEPLQRLSQRTARGEARAAVLERRLEQLQQASKAPPTPIERFGRPEPCAITPQRC